VYLAVIGFVLIGLLIWLRYESGTWSGPVAAPDDSVSTGRCVLLAAVVLHETLLQSLALRGLVRQGGGLSSTGPVVVLALVALGLVVPALFIPRLRWLAVIGYALHALGYFLIRAWLWQVGFWETYLAAAAVGLVGMMLWQGVRDGRWWGP